MGFSLAALAVGVQSFEFAAEDWVFAIVVEVQMSDPAVAVVHSMLLLGPGIE